jgi:ketosteroid isomerase-like protein
MLRAFAFALVLISFSAQAQEVPLDNCRQLPILKATVGGHGFQFLLDTGAAATLLNLKSFSSLDSAEITLESWNGTVATRAQEVVLHDFTIGEHSLTNLKLLAIDLTALERSCQKRVDGVLGADLIQKLGLTIDLKNHVAVLDDNARTPESKLNELERHQAACVQAFNHSDAKAFEECLDPEIVVLTSHGDFHGRKAVMKHFKDAYFGQDPPVVVSMTPLTRRAIGNVVWMEYEMSVNKGPQVMKTRGTALYQKSGERWLMSNMNFSVGGDK